ncbi:unnamed protein product [Paramecium sonneborni]|uniref:WD40-repeat-containing domain n=1 Tax=Paramecium sonneborni TaxID=65129 RepID=A0A8S1RWK1_9CILI|nr:unnamed protein product [Paramecium sonneborni]
MDQQIDDQEDVDNLITILEDLNFFEDYSVELLYNQVTQLSNQDKEIIKKPVGYTLYQFYKLYVALYHESEQFKAKNSEQDFKWQLNEFQMRLAVYMSSFELTNIPQKKLQKEGKTHFKFIYDYFDTKKDFLRCALIKLENTQRNSRVFCRKIYFETYQRFQKCFLNRSVEKNIETSSFNQYEFNLSSSKFNGVLNMIKVELENYDDIKETLIQILQLSTNNNCIRAASNSIFMINYLGMELVGEDLRGIQLEDTNISGLNFFGQYFRQIKIYRCLNIQLQFQQCKLKISRMEENTLVKQGIRFSPNNKILVSWGKKKVCIWNLQTKKIKKELNLEGYVESCIFSSDSSKILLLFNYEESMSIISIYLIDEEDIKLLISTPYRFNYPLSFYNNQDKIISLNYRYNCFQVLDLINQIKQKSEWIQQIIVDKKDFPLTTFNLYRDDEVLLGTEDGSIFQWDILSKSIKPLLKNVHKSQIIQIQSDNTFINKDFLISTSQDQVNIWCKINEQYKKINSLPSLKVNGQLPRYYLSQHNLILFKKDHIIFYNKLRILHLLQRDKIFKNCNCLTEVKIQQFKNPQENADFLYIFIASDNCIEYYEISGDQKMIDTITLDNFKPISIQFCLSNCIISYNQDETIRF